MGGVCTGAYIQPGGKIVAVGNSSNSVAIARYNPDGSPDETFGADGIILIATSDPAIDFGCAADFLPDGSILAGGTSGGNLALWRYSPGGIDSTVDVTNVAPTLAPIDDIAVKPGQILDLTNSATFTDPGFDDPQGTPPTSEYFTYSIDWGDNQSDTDMWVDNVTQGHSGTLTHGAIDASHIYDAPGTYQVSLTITDDDGGTSDTANFNVTVAKPTVAISGDATVSLGENYTLTIGDVNNPGGDAVQAYTVHWGDGLEDTYAADDIAQNSSITHTYRDAPAHNKPITVDLIDDSGTYADLSDTFTVDVNPFMSTITKLDFDATSSNIIHVANFGPTITYAELQLSSLPEDVVDNGHLTAPTIDSAGNGTIKWEQDTNTLPADFDLTVTAYYNNETWPVIFPVHFTAPDLPSVFPSHDMAVSYYYGGSISFAACDKEDATLDYTIITKSSSPDLPTDAYIDPYGNFSCTFTVNDAYKIYEFDVTAKDSADQTDTMHVVISANLLFHNPSMIAANIHTSVDVNSTGTQLDFVSSSGRAIFYVDPELHYNYQGGGSVTEIMDNGEPTGRVQYTPAEDFRGMDKITYYWTYDLYDYYGELVEEGASTNTATAYIQVGPFCDLTASGMTMVDDKYVLDAGETASATFTMDNPRGDGCPVTGIWSLDFDPSIVKISNDGAEIIPNKMNLIKDLTSSQPITLTLEGVSGGDTGITASWSIWTSPNASPNQQFALGTGQTMQLAAIKIKLDKVAYNSLNPQRCHDIIADPKPNAPVYGGFQWENDNDGKHQWPVCYTRSGPYGPVYADAYIEVEVVAGNTSRFTDKLRVRGSGTIGSAHIDFIESMPVYNDGTYISDILNSEQEIPYTVYDSYINIKWELSYNSGNSWLTLGTTKNEIYSTWSDPTCPILYESYLYIGCNAANGATDNQTDASLVNTIYSNSFGNLSVKRKDGTEMKYFHERNPAMTAAQMLGNKTGYGQCTAWADLMVQVLAAQGIGAREYTITTISPYIGFRVDFVPAQGSGPVGYPRSNFSYHVVIRVDEIADTIFDPSYGTKVTKNGSDPKSFFVIMEQIGV